MFSTSFIIKHESQAQVKKKFVRDYLESNEISQKRKNFYCTIFCPQMSEKIK